MYVQLHTELRYINAECVSTMKGLADGSVGLVVVDPPYGVEFRSDNVPDGGSWDVFRTREDFSSFNVGWMSEAYRVLREGGIMWMFGDIARSPELVQSLREAGFTVQLGHLQVMNRSKGRAASSQFKSLREEIFCASKGLPLKLDDAEWYERGVRRFISEGRPRGWYIDIATGKRMRWDGMGSYNYFTMPFYRNVAEKMIHACQKPLLMWCKLIMEASEPGDVVLDPFAGSFSSGIASGMCGRNYIGIERDADMFGKACAWRDAAFDGNSRVSTTLDGYLFEKVDLQFGATN